MAVDPNRQTLIQQLGEMRSTRMQQMRTGSQQTQMMGRQVQLTQSMSAALQNNSRQLSTLNTTMSSGFRNLSSSFASSMRGLTSAVSRGAVGAASAAGGAAAGVGRVSASAVSGVTSGVVSALSMALPAAIAGVIGKSLIWDNIDDSTKKEMGENIGGIFKNVFGDSLQPVTKELKVMTMTLADTLESLSDRIGSVVSGIKGKLPALKDGAGETASNVSNKASNAAQEATQKLPRGVKVAGLMARDATDVAVKGYDLLKGTEAPEFEQVKTGAVAVGTAAAGYQASKFVKESIPLAKTAEKGAGFKGSLNQQAMNLLKKDGSKVTKLSLLTARMVVRITVAGGATAAKVLGAIVKFKLDRAASVIGPIIQLVGLWYVLDTIESMVADKTITPEDGKELADFAKKQALFSGAGSFVVGGLAAAAGVAGGGFLSVPLGILGSIGGSMLGSYAAEKTTKFSAGITAEIPEAKQEPGMNLTSQILNLKEKKGEKKNQASNISKPSAGATTSSRDDKGENGSAQKAMDFFMSRGYTKEQAAGIVGNLKVESATFSTIDVGDKDRPEGPSIGIAQWDPKRQADFKRIFKKDIKEASFEEQLAFIDWELNNTEAVAGQKLRGAKSAEEAALMIDAFYERSAGSSTKGGGKGGAKIKQRQQAALALMGGGAQSTMMAGTGAGAASDTSTSLPIDQVSAAQKPTAGMSIKQKIDYFRDQLGGDQANKPAEGKGETQQKPASPFSAFASLIGGGSFESMKNELLAGLDSDMERKAEGSQGGNTIINNNGGDTNVTSSGGGGGSAPVYNPIAPAASYQSQFTSIAGIQRTA